MKEERVREFYDGTDVLMSEITYVDGSAHGWSYGWYRNRQLKYKSPYKDGNFHGVQRRWNMDGEVTSLELYESGQFLEFFQPTHQGILIVWEIEIIS